MTAMIISLGGSLIVPEKINKSFIKELKKIILNNISANSFIIVIGGGQTCRDYQDAARSISPTTEDDLDLIGIAATHLNAELLRSILGDHAYENVITNPTKKIKTSKKVIIAAGWKPGHSTDYDAVCLAKTYHAKTIINMTNVDYLYDKNPKEHKDAQRIEKASWSKLQSIVGMEWKPGLHRPFDPIATKKAGQLGLTLFIVGPDINNLKNVLEHKKFNGTIVSNKT